MPAVRMHQQNEEPGVYLDLPQLKAYVMTALERTVSMPDSCCCPNEVCDLPAKDLQRPILASNACPECGKLGKPVQGQTVKALVSVSLREVEDTKYLFCRTQSCSVVYFSAENAEAFTFEHVREQVYQKEPEADDVVICYCFGHTVGDLRNASPEKRLAVVDNIDIRINAGQCACDLRNPQGSCCLGNVRAMIKQLETSTSATS